jgi:hypothetical protein
MLASNLVFPRSAREADLRDFGPEIKYRAFAAASDAPAKQRAAGPNG